MYTVQAYYQMFIKGVWALRRFFRSYPRSCTQVEP